jgi:hypothetical protein
MRQDQVARGSHRIGSKPKLVEAATKTKKRVVAVAVAADLAEGDRRC